MKVRNAMLGIGLLLSAVAVPALRADTIQTFSANGLLTDGTIIGGTLTVDTTSGAVESSGLTATGPITANFSVIAGDSHYSYNGSGYDLIYDEAADGKTELNFSVSPSFSGFQGGSVNGGNIFYPPSFTYGPNISFLSFATQASAPEPSSLLLLGTGILGFAGAARRRLHV